LWMARIAAFSIGAGMGLSNTTFIVSVQNSAEPAIRGIATASTLFTRMLGSAIGTAVLGATLNLNLEYRLPQVNDPVQQLMEKATRSAMDSGQLNMLTDSVAASLHWVFVVSAVVSVLAVAAGLLIPSGDRPRREAQRES